MTRGVVGEPAGRFTARITDRFDHVVADDPIEGWSTFHVRLFRAMLQCSKSGRSAGRPVVLLHAIPDRCHLVVETRSKDHERVSDSTATNVEVKVLDLAVTCP